MDGGLQKVHCKSDTDFRKTQSYLDTNQIAYTTLSPAEQRPGKIVIRRIPSYTDFQLNIDALKKYDFTANRAFMMNSKKTGYPNSLYVVNVLPRAKYEEIYNIKEIYYFRVVIERLH